MTTTPNNSGGLAAWFAVPRVFTLPLFALLGLAGGHFLWSWDAMLAAGVFGVAVPFCVMCTASVWAARSRLNGVVDTELLSARAYAAFMRLIAVQRKRSNVWSIAAASAGLLTLFAALSIRLGHPIGQSMAYVGGLAIAVALYARLLAGYWEVQTRAFESSQVNASSALRWNQS